MTTTPLRLGAALAALIVTLPLGVAGQGLTIREVTGHASGERVTLHHEMVAYVRALAERSPRVTAVVQGHSWEGRELLLAIVTSPENHARLDEIRANSLRLADGRTTSPEEAERIIAGQPAIVWFGGSIHGFELSGAEGALKLLEHLATRDDPATLEVLANTVVLIDPMLNPDGREAFASINHENIGRNVTSDPRDWSNDFTGWQGTKYRTGHYYFDTNRDWFAHTQMETRERMATLHAWRAQVAVDMHEMGSGTEFYFDPPGLPYNPYFPQFARDWFARFGAAYAEAFDSAGFEYMTGERYNYFYPGYTSNRGYQGAVAMLFEQGSSRGLTLERPDGSVRTLADALEQQYVGAWTAVRTAATNRETLLREYAASQRAILTEAQQGTRRYLIPNEGDPLLVQELVGLLRRNAIEVGRLTEPATLTGVRDRTGATVGRRTFPAGTYVVERAQPSGRVASTLLEPETPLPESFLQQARAYVDRDENPRFYDITAWSLPLLFDVGGYSTADARALPVEMFAPESEAAAPESGALPGWEHARYAYVVDGRSAASLAVLYHLTAAGHRAAVLWAPTVIDGDTVAGGSVIVRVGQNDASVHEAVRRLAARYGVGVRAVQTGFSATGGPALGSGDFTFNVREPRIAILAEDPIAGYGFGYAWYTLDVQYGIPVTVLRTRSVASTDLAHYNVLVVPPVSGGALADVLGASGMDRLRTWIRDGGTLVTIGVATDFARNQLDMLSLRSWYDTDEGEDATRYDVPGAVFRAEVDRGYWMAAGYDDGDLPVLVDSDRLYLAPEGPPNSRRRVIARYATSDPLLSGHAWPESLERIPGAVFVYDERVGGGRIVAFAEDPNYRAYFRGANRLFLNAVILGPSGN